MKAGFLIHFSESTPEVVEVRREGEDWCWVYRNEEAQLSLRSNDDFESSEAAIRSASVAYPHLEPVVIDVPPPATGTEVSRAAELRRLLAVGAAAGAAAGLAWWQRHRSTDE